MQEDESILRRIVEVLERPANTRDGEVLDPEYVLNDKVSEPL